MPHRPSRTTLARAAIALAALCAALPLRAADEFKVSPAQMQALGIQLQRLDKPSPIAGLAYPAVQAGRAAARPDGDQAGEGRVLAVLAAIGGRERRRRSGGHRRR